MSTTVTKALTPLEQRFVAEYLIDFKAGPAAVRAGYSPKSYSAACRMLLRPHVALEIQRRCLTVQAKLSIDADDVRRGIARIATDPRDSSAGGPTHSERLAAWRELGKLLGMYIERTQVSGTLTLDQLLLAAEKRAGDQPTAH